MAKDYFSDIDSSDTSNSSNSVDGRPSSEDSSVSEKSIRNISVSARRTALTQRMPSQDQRQRPDAQPTTKSRSKRTFPLIAGLGVVLILSAIIALVLIFGNTTKVTITPRVQQVNFDPATTFTAYPKGNSDSTGMEYVTDSFTLEESKTVAANGVEKAEDRASGSVTVFNAYSDKPTRLIKNTRFESPDGLVFRIPASIEVPGKKGSTPGQITVTVFADQAGAQYNIGPTERFTVPGLKSTPEMYSGIYARSTTAFDGGFSGDKPAVLPATLEAARAELRSILQSKIQERIKNIDGTAFLALTNIQYESSPTIADPVGGAKVTEKARVTVPVFSTPNFATAIAQAVSADAGSSEVSLRPQGELIAQFSGNAPELGTAPINFSLRGSALIVWNVDAAAVRDALAGKEQSAFKPIIANFAGVKDAEARPPFWTSKFPSADNIEVVIVDPTNAQ